MTAEGPRDIFLSCFKCGRIVRSSDNECPRCGLKFGPGTLFECPFCCGLVWRNATTCSTCGIDLTKFSESVERASSGFDMDDFVDTVINTELEEMKSTVRRVSCPGCGLMIRGDESKCPRCDLPLEEAEADCPICGEKIPIASTSCPNCKAVFEKAEKVSAESVIERPAEAPKAKAKAKAPAPLKTSKPKAPRKAPPGKKKTPSKKGKKRPPKKG
jgi:RNA polymerase subunit RPABC4/transcription elongation factor Spt4